MSLRGNGPVLASCLSHLMTDNVLRNACSVKGFIYSELRRAVNALVHTDQTFEVFQQLCYPFAKSALGEKSFKMRDFLILMKVSYSLAVVRQNNASSLFVCFARRSCDSSTTT